MRRLLYLLGVPLMLAAILVARSDVACAGDSRDADELRRLVEERVRSLGIQTARPKPTEDRGRDYAPAGGGSGAMLSAETAYFLMWAAIAVFAVVLALTLYDNAKPVPDKAGKKGRKRDQRADDGVLRRMDGGRRESEELAAAGDYAAAMHILLLRAVEEMRRRLGIPIAVSLTSREILGRVGMGPAAHAALAEIIDRVEISWFGTHLPGAEEYARCRESFLALTGALAGGQG